MLMNSNNKEFLTESYRSEEDKEKNNNLTKADMYSPLVWAYIGDAVYELRVRERLIEKSYGEYEGVSFAEYGAGLKDGETRGMELDSDAADRVEAFFKRKARRTPR